MHTFSPAFDRCLVIGAFRALLLAALAANAAGAANQGSDPPAPTKVTIRQLEEVRQGMAGEFAVEISPEEEARPVVLRLACDAGVGRATFAGGSTQIALQRGGRVAVLGITSNDLPGGLTLTAWPEGAARPAASAFFDVLPASLEPRIFFGGQDVTRARQSVALGQAVQLSVFLHPGLPVESEEWIIGKPGDYTGGFLHTPLQGGPQPIVRGGSTTRFYWVTQGDERRVEYRVRLANGETATAETFFDVDGPSSTQVQVNPVTVMIAPGTTPNSSVLGLQGSGMTFHANYWLPDGLVKNFTWVQLILSDSLKVKSRQGGLLCVPKSQPVAEFGAGLDSGYPYDSANPTRDNPPLQVTPDTLEYSRVFHARMYLLWSSGLSNSIPVPLGYVDWSFSGEVLLEDAASNRWQLKSGQAGADNPEQPFVRSHAYPLWHSLVPYAGVLTCN